MNFFFYCDTPNIDDTHIVHTDTCCSLPEILERTLIGKAESYEEALDEIQKKHPDKIFSSCIKCC